VPYVFTPPHEHPLDHARRGTGANVGPLEQVLGPIRWLGAHRQVRRWALIGNDYVWRGRCTAPQQPSSPWRYEVVLDTLVPIGEVDTQRLVGAAERAGADALLVSLIGRDGITFQRDFADSASRPLIRLY
jgi:hypothetical protein